MRHPASRVALHVSAAMSFALPAAAQGVTEKELGEPNATIKNVFKTPEVAQILPDGRLVVVDSKLEKMLRADFGNGAAQELMKQGDDPGQYGDISKLWLFRGDTIAAFDVARRVAVLLPADGGAPRMLPLGGGGRGGGMGAGRGAMGGRGGAAGRGGGRGGAPGGMRAPAGPFNPEFLVDGQYLYGFAAAPPTPNRPGFAPPRTTLPILRMSLPTRAMDTIARFLPRQPNKASVTIQNRNSGVFSMTSFHDISSFIPADAWFVYRDGTVGVVRGADYRIDLYGPGDQRSKLDPLPFPQVPITSAEKKKSIDSFKRAEQERVSTMQERSAAMIIDDEAPYPPHHPPFRHDAGVIVDELDRVWLAVRCASTDKAECYDVIDRQGQRVMRLRLPERTTLLAVTKDHVYTTFAEKADKAVLQRHPLN